MPDTGSGQWPYPNSSATPDVPADVLLLAQRIDLMASGWTVTANATTRGALVTNGDAYEGLHVYQIDTKVAYLYTGSAWIPDLHPVNRQLDTSNDVVGLKVQAGIGKIAGAAALIITETVTFPVSFATSTNPVVVLQFSGAKATGAFDPTSTTTSSTVSAHPSGISNSSFTANIIRDTNMSAASDYYYDWIAYGVPA